LLRQSLDVREGTTKDEKVDYGFKNIANRFQSSRKSVDHLNNQEEDKVATGFSPVRQFMRINQDQRYIKR
jgi:hypothetical protein